MNPIEVIANRAASAKLTQARQALEIAIDSLVAVQRIMMETDKMDVTSYFDPIAAQQAALAAIDSLSIIVTSVNLEILNDEDTAEIAQELATMTRELIESRRAAIIDGTYEVSIDA